jgi:single-strand DNA-binding protein
VKALNRVELIGHVGKDPEIKYTSQGVPLAKLSLATTSRQKDKAGEWNESTEWHHVVMWGKLAELAAEHIKKGSHLFVEGKLQTTSWEDKKSGQKKYMTQVVAEQFILLGGRPATTSTAITESHPITDADVPF